MIVHSTSKIDQRGATISEVSIKGGLVQTLTRDRRKANVPKKQPPVQDKLSNNSLADKIGKVAPAKSCALRVIMASSLDAIAQAN